VKTQALDTGTGLPASIEAAWGLRERPGKAARPWLSLERIVAAAVGIAETEGLGAVAMSRVAADLGAATMSLYRYVAAKDELLALMVDSTYGPPPARQAGEPWREGLSRWAWAQHSALRKHSWVVRVPITEPPSTPNQIAWLEAGLACLTETGIDEGTKLSVILLIHSFLRSEATLVSEINAGIRAVGSTSPQAMAAYGRLLAKLTNPDQFPALRAVIDAGVFDQAYAPDSEFAFGLDRLLDGVETMIATRCGSR
jgi:AcrR family transcriptional regulator